MTKKEVDDVLLFAGSEVYYRIKAGVLVGVSKFQAFLAIKQLLNGKLYWYALRKAYDMSDNLYVYRNDVKDVFLNNIIGRDSMMLKYEKEYLNSLPNEITIYRGMTIEESISNSFGISWTLKKEKAEFFANTYGRNHDTQGKPKTVMEIKINKKEVIAFFKDRKEYEIIYINTTIEN